MDLSRESLRYHEERYAHLLCPDCRTAIEKRCQPIMDKMNRGIKPGLYDMVRLLNVLCSDCTESIAKEMKRG